MDQATKIIKNIEKQITPFDIVKCISNVLDFLGQCNKFFFGMTSSSYDDTDCAFNYILIRSNPKSLNSIYEYCFLFYNILEGEEKSKLGGLGNIIDKIKISKLDFYHGIWIWWKGKTNWKPLILFDIFFSKNISFMKLNFN